MSDTRVNVLDPDGNPATLDASEVPAAVAKGGYKVATPEQVKDFKDEQQFGEGALNHAKAFGAAAARTATFGGSDQLLTRTGLAAPDTLDQLKKHNTVSDLAGTATGVIAPMLVGDELAPLNLVKGVSGLGSAAERVAANALPEGTSLASRVLKAARSKAVGSSVEGAAYGLGNAVSENALGDADLSAQHILGKVGIASLLGGGLGAALGVGEAVIPQAVSAARDALVNTTERAKGLLGDGFTKAASSVSGVPESTISEALENRASVLQSPEERSKAAEGFANSIAEQYNATEKALKTANRDIRPLETADLVKDADPTAVNNEYQRVFNRVGDAIQEMRAKPDIYPSRFASKLEDVQTSLLREGQAAQTPAEVFKTINELKQSLDSKVLKFDGVASAADSDAINLVKSLRTDIKKSLENEEVYGPAAARQSAFNEAQNEYLTAKKEFEKAFLYKTRSNSGSVVYKANPTKANTFFNQLGDVKNELRKQALDRYMQASSKLVDQLEESYSKVPSGSFNADAANSLGRKNSALIEEQAKQKRLASVMGAVNTGAQGTNPLVAGGVASALGLPGAVFGAGVAGFNALKNPGGTIQRLASMEAIIQKSAAKVEQGVRAVVSGSSRAFSVGRGEVAAGLASEFGDSHDVSVPTYRKRVEEVQAFASNPNALVDKLHGATADLYEHAPNVTEAMHATTVRGISFLASKIEQHPKQGPLDADWTPSKSEISTFNRYWVAVQKPTAILKQAAAGTLTPEGVEAVQAVYPDLYKHIQGQVVDVLSDKKAGSVTFRQKQMLSLLTGTNMNGATLPASIAANQAIFASSGGGGGQPSTGRSVRPSQAGLGKLALSESLLTRGQATSQRK